MRAGRPAWAGRNCTILTAATAISGLGHSGALIAAAFAVLGAGGSATDVGLVAAAHLGGPGPWGVALGAFGAGTVGGALLMTRYRPRRLLLTGSLCVFPLALPSAAPAVPLSAVWLTVVMGVTGVAVEVFSVTWMTALHQEIPEEKFSRVSSYDWLGSLAGIPLATVLAGPVQDAVGLPAALWGCAGLVVLLTAAVLCVPDVRRLVRRTPDAAGTAAPAGAAVPPVAEDPAVG